MLWVLLGFAIFKSDIRDRERNRGDLTAGRDGGFFYGRHHGVDYLNGFLRIVIVYDGRL